MLMLGILSKKLLTNSRLYAKSMFSICSKSKSHMACGKWNSASSAHTISRQRVPVRYLFGVFRRPKKEQLKIIDNIPDEYHMIYRNTMERYITLIQIFTTLCSVILIVVILTRNDHSNYNSIYPLEEDLPQATENEVYYYIAAFVALVAILQIIVYKLPMRIYYLPQEKKYTFVFYGPYPTTKRKLTCHVGEVAKIPDEGNLKWWKEMKYQIEDQQDIILTESSFRRPADLYVMLGIQRDPDEEKPK